MGENPIALANVGVLIAVLPYIVPYTVPCVVPFVVSCVVPCMEDGLYVNPVCPGGGLAVPGRWI